MMADIAVAGERREKGASTAVHGLVFYSVIMGTLDCLGKRSASAEDRDRI
jgi:hypothetical protein